MPDNLEYVQHWTPVLTCIHELTSMHLGNSWHVVCFAVLQTK